MDRITERQVELFFRFGGDSDGLARVGTQDEKAAVSNAAWFAIMELAQAAAQSKRQLLDAEAQRALADALRERCADESAARKLIALA